MEPRLPRRAIFSESNLRAFQRSPSHRAIVQLVEEGARAIRCVPRGSGAYERSAVVAALCEAFEVMGAWIDEIPPLRQPMRFGNRAFCDWHRRLESEGPRLLSEALCSADNDGERFRLAGEGGDGSLEESFAYLLQAFGHHVRIDYGTGHETCFVMWWLALRRAGAVTPQDSAAMVMDLFGGPYLSCVRRLQLVYMLEPAGSHGVWGLDDFHCLPFVWGAAQLCAPAEEPASPDGGGDGDPRPEALRLPQCVRNGNLLEEQGLGREWLYVAAIKHVLTIKTGAPFHEVAPMLHDISGLPSWERVLRGLQRLYLGEVLGKLPVVQHFLFGELIPADWRADVPPEPVRTSALGVMATALPLQAHARLPPHQGAAVRPAVSQNGPPPGGGGNRADGPAGVAEAPN